VIFSLGHWLLYLLASLIVLSFLVKGVTAHHTDSPAALGLAAVFHA